VQSAAEKVQGKVQGKVAATKSSNRTSTTKPLCAALLFCFSAPSFAKRKSMKTPCLNSLAHCSAYRREKREKWEKRSQLSPCESLFFPNFGAPIE